MTLSPEAHSSREDEIPVPHPQLLRDLNAGQMLLLDDRDLSLTIEARGDGGSLKARIQTCNQVGKPVITATQMLQRMIDHPRATLAPPPIPSFRPQRRNRSG